MQHFNKYGIAALMFFMGTTLPAVAQDEAQDEVATEVPAEKAKKNGSILLMLIAAIAPKTPAIGSTIPDA